MNQTRDPILAIKTNDTKQNSCTFEANQSKKNPSGWTQAKFNQKTMAIMVGFFSMTSPCGIGVGIAISNTYNENSPTALVVEGLLLSASAGILIYMALVDLLAADFINNAKMLSNPKLQFGASFTLLLGAGFMSLLAKLGDQS